MDKENIYTKLMLEQKDSVIRFVRDNSNISSRNKNIVIEYCNGMKQVDIAKKYNLSRSSIRMILYQVFVQFREYNENDDFKNLSVSIKNSLRRRGLNNFRDVKEYIATYGSICKVRNIGKSAEKEILKELNKYENQCW